MFYKFDNGQLYSNGTVTGPLYDLYPESEGWYWFPGDQEALVFFGIDPTAYTDGIIFVDK